MVENLQLKLKFLEVQEMTNIPTLGKKPIFHYFPTNHHNHIGFHHRFKGLRTSGLTQGCFQTVTRWRMTNPRTGICVVITKCSTDQFLNQVGFFVRTAG